jgi:LacI family transcriptional regulator
MDYRPNQLAVSLIKRRTKTIGLIVSDISNSFFGSLAKGVEDECRRQGWTMVLCNTNDKHERDIEYINVLYDKGVDGIIFDMSGDSSIEKAEESCKLMDKLNIPFVMIDRSLDSEDYCSIILDHRTGGYIATKHLIDLGRTRIACVTGPSGLNDSRDRFEGYRCALQAAGIPYDPELVFEGNYTVESGKKAGEYFRSKDIQAVFTFNDMMAYGLYYEFKKENISMPGTVSIVGYDDIFFSEIMELPLTSVKQPIYEMGETAVRQIIGLVKNKNDSQKCIIFKPDLVIRESTAPLEPPPIR